MPGKTPRKTGKDDPEGAAGPSTGQPGPRIRSVAEDDLARVPGGAGPTNGGDLVWGTGGNDTLNAGAGGDLVFGREGNDVILEAGTDADLIDGGEGNDFIRSLGGNDRVYAGHGQDTIYGGDGNDTVMLGRDYDSQDSSHVLPGNHLLHGEAGNDTVDWLVSGVATSSHFDGGSGTDTIRITLGYPLPSGDPVFSFDVLFQRQDGALVFNGPASGTITWGNATLTFTNVERIILP